MFIEKMKYFTVEKQHFPFYDMYYDAENLSSWLFRNEVVLTDYVAKRDTSFTFKLDDDRLIEGRVLNLDRNFLKISINTTPFFYLSLSIPQVKMEEGNILLTITTQDEDFDFDVVLNHLSEKFKTSYKKNNA